MKILEFDTDGVLADIYTSLTPHLTDIIPDFSEDTHIQNWTMSNIKEEYPLAYTRIMSLFTTPKFIAGLPRYAKVLEALHLLRHALDSREYQVSINTHIMDASCVISRDTWLRDLRQDANMDFNIIISQEDIKRMQPDSYILVEDSVENCRRSNATYKFLVRRGHNRGYTEKDLGVCEAAYVVPDFYTAVEIMCEKHL